MLSLLEICAACMMVVTVVMMAAAIPNTKTTPLKMDTYFDLIFLNSRMWNNGGSMKADDAVASPPTKVITNSKRGIMAARVKARRTKIALPKHTSA